ncbi:MAG: NAD(P)-dependent alcohol dehydrogenase [Rhodospirillaceae bacterium]|nr:NAD(P)-dependent alcohol dehydrogenase [Rhodospirillaceae bacterium]
MKVVELREAWSLDNLVLTERPRPEPGPGQVLLKVRAAAINFRDIVMCKGGYGRFAGELPLVPVSDCVAEVVGHGEGVTRVGVGDRVCPIFCQKWISGPPTPEKLSTALGGPLDGALAEYMVVDAEGVVPAPPHLSELQAATLPCAAITAWSAVVTQGAVTAGDTVVVQGSGGVSVFALQFAKCLGAEVVATSSSDEKLERLRALGADHVINYRTTPDWGKLAKAMTGGRGADLIVDVGGAATLPQALRAVRVGGQIALIGVVSGNTVELPLGPVVTQNLRLQAITVGSREAFEAMNRAIEINRIEPVVDRVFPFTEIRAALDYLASGQHFGKVCLSYE